MAVTPVPFGDEIEGFAKNLFKASAKRSAAEIGSKIFKMLQTSTEPFFRREMGERHFGPGAVAAGYTLWSLSALASGLFGMFFGKAYGVMSFIVGFGMVGAFGYFAEENKKRLGEFRVEGKTYHSRSRGQSRLADPATEATIKMLGGLALLFLAPVTGVSFIASLIISANLVAQQQAALHDRYLDALDAQIEGEFLQDALLGKCPPEITYLYKPLPPTLKPELREDIAAAAVGKPVKIVAQAPKATRPAATPTPLQPT
jgi:hypothetical protein